MKWSWRKKVKDQTQMSVYTELNIEVKSGRGLSMTHDGESFSPWRDFNKWYFGRPQSVVYNIRHKRGSQTIVRSNIVGFSLERKYKHIIVT